MKNFNFENIKKYYDSPSFKNDLSISHTGNISFHWSNHRDVKNKIRDKFRCLKFLSKEIWIKNEQSYLSMSTDDLLSFVTIKSGDKEIMDSLFEIKEISLHGKSGPYCDLSLIDCFNRLDIESKYLEMTLKNKVPQRGFRLNCTDEILMCFDENFLKETKISIHQFSNTGLLFKSESGDFNEILESHKEFKFYINSESKKLVSSFYSEYEKDAFVISKSNLKISYPINTDEVFLFIKFRDIENKILKRNLKNYLEYAEEKILKAAS